MNQRLEKRLAFPRAGASFDSGAEGMELRHWFATFAPEPTEEELKHQFEVDRARNPHGDSYKSPRRSKLEVIADLKYAYADAMVRASEKPK